MTRPICEHCKQPINTTPPTTIRLGGRCPECGTWKIGELKVAAPPPSSPSSPADAAKIDELLNAFQVACDSLNKHDCMDIDGWKDLAKERAILRNELRAKLLAARPRDTEGLERAATQLLALCGNDGEVETAWQQAVSDLRRAIAAPSLSSQTGSAEDATLDRLAKLLPDWDSYGAKAPDPTSIATARKLVRLLAGEWAIVPTSDGGVQLERHAEGFEAEITIPPGDGDTELYLIPALRSSGADTQ